MGRASGGRHECSGADPASATSPSADANRVAAVKLLRARGKFSVVPVYFCMSGGLVADLDDSVLVALPASAREPIRRSRDAAFVADRMRLLAQATRVRILIHLLSEPSGVMELSRALAVSQPSVSTHIQQLLAAGLVRPKRAGTRRVYVAAPLHVDRLLEDARATLAGWEPLAAKAALRPGPRR